VADATRSKSELMLENALLRRQLIVLDRQGKRPQLNWRERGAERIRGEMLKQNMGVAKSRIQGYTQDLRRVGPSGQSWGAFLRCHASEIWACDFLQTYVALFRSIFVFVIIELESRQVVHVNVTRHPTDAWVA
jgi:putative transposase